jgi:hypothetical protein
MSAAAFIPPMGEFPGEFIPLAFDPGNYHFLSPAAKQQAQLHNVSFTIQANITHRICAGNDPYKLMYISSTLIVRQTLPSRIHHPGSISLRHLGEQANDKVRATLHRPQNICLFRLLYVRIPHLRS